MIPKGAERLSDERLRDLGLNLTALYDVLDDDWVFGGALLRLDFEYIANVIDDGPWVAMATKVNNTQLGPIPEARGHGKDMVSAIADLRRVIMEMGERGGGG